MRPGMESACFELCVRVWNLRVLNGASGMESVCFEWCVRVWNRHVLNCASGYGISKFRIVRPGMESASLE